MSQDLDSELLRLRRENADFKSQIEAKNNLLSSLKFQLSDWQESAETAWKSPCADEHHCTCVPLLKKTLDDKEKENADLKAKISGTRGRGLEDGQAIEAEKWGETLGPLVDVDCDDTHHSDMLTRIRGGVIRLRDKHYRECEEIARNLPRGYSGQIRDGADVAAELIARAREGK